MSDRFLIYGATGFVGEAITRQAVQSGLRPTVAGRDMGRVEALASELGVDYRVFGLEDVGTMKAALKDVDVVLHCAGPYIHTFQPMVDACLRTETHYLDITGEVPVYQAIATRNGEAKSKGVMLLPGVGFDVVPTDCLAAHLQRRLPAATHLTLAFHMQGPAGFPPGSLKTMVEMIPYGTSVRRDGQLVSVSGTKTRMFDFGQGPSEAMLLTWGDVFMAYHSTGIPNIEDYSVLSEKTIRQAKMVSVLQPLFRLAFVRNIVKRGMKGGSTVEERSKSRVHVWGEVKDKEGQGAAARLHGPEGGVEWTTMTALAAVDKVLTGDYMPGFQTPALAYGPDFVLECEGVTREDL